MAMLSLMGCCKVGIGIHLPLCPIWLCMTSNVIAPCDMSLICLNILSFMAYWALFLIYPRGVRTLKVHKNVKAHIIEKKHEPKLQKLVYDSACCLCFVDAAYQNQSGTAFAEKPVAIVVFFTKPVHSITTFLFV